MARGTKRALVLDDGASATAVAAARGLAAGGWCVGLGSPVRGPAWGSRSVRARHVVPSPGEGRERFVSGVEQLLTQTPYDVVVPTSDAQLLALSAERDRVPSRLLGPSHAVLEAALDKVRLTELADDLGLAVPRTVRPQEVAPDDLGEWVVKPRLHWARDAAADLPTLATRLVRGGAEVRRAVQEVEAAGGDAVVQEAVRGDLVAYVSLVDDAGEVVAAVQQRALSVYPAGAGNCVRGRVEQVDPSLAEGAARLLAALGWRGLAQLELVQAPGRRPALIDLNGRCYGSMALAVASGLNLPALAADLAVGAPARPGAARVGTRYSATGLDLRRALAEPAGRGRAVAGALLGGLGAAHPLWDVRDPGPSARWGRVVARSAARKVRWG